MYKRRYQSPIFMLSGEESGSVVGPGSNTGSIPAEGMTYDEWWDEIAWGGANPDADYNGDGKINEDDYLYWIDNHLWES